MFPFLMLIVFVIFVVSAFLIPDPRKAYVVVEMTWHETGFWHAITSDSKGNLKSWVSRRDRWLRSAPGLKEDATEAPNLVSKLLADWVKHDEDKHIVQFYRETMETVSRRADS